MTHHNTVLAQMLKLIPRHEIESLARQHHSGRTLRKMTCWTQFVSMATAQASLRWNDGGAKWVYRHPANPLCHARRIPGRSPLRHLWTCLHGCTPRATERSDEFDDKRQNSDADAEERAEPDGQPLLHLPDSRLLSVEFLLQVSPEFLNIEF